jgi:Mg/Co/Ni transporter MgtE
MPIRRALRELPHLPEDAYLPVVDRSGRYLGAVQSRAAARESTGALAKDVLTSPARDVAVIAVAPTTPLRQVAYFDSVRRHGAAMVVDERGVLKGVIDGVRMRAILDALRNGRPLEAAYGVASPPA